jgi:hypothetical protein
VRLLRIESLQCVRKGPGGTILVPHLLNSGIKCSTNARQQLRGCSTSAAWDRCIHPSGTGDCSELEMGHTSHLDRWVILIVKGIIVGVV